ncbi:MAG: hypothetical protein AAF752_16030, partial [Bacteroidota bacterium]
GHQALRIPKLAHKHDLRHLLFSRPYRHVAGLIRGRWEIDLRLLLAPYKGNNETQEPNYSCNHDVNGKMNGGETPWKAVCRLRYSRRLRDEWR